MPIPKQLENRCRVPVIGAPMFLISTPRLVIAQCKAGVIGAFPALNARPQSQLREWIKEIKQALSAHDQSEAGPKSAPFAVNLVALSTNKRFESDLEVCIEEKVPIIITSMRPPEEVAKRVHAYGGLHFHDVTTRRHAEKAIEAGVDGLILVCAGAGGHGGLLNPFAFIKEVRSIYQQGMIIVAGCITTGQEVRACEVVGADMAYIGTGFIATEEANAESAYKEMIIEAKSDDILYTPDFTGVNANFLKESIQNCGVNPETVSGPRVGRVSKFVLWWKHWRLKHVKRWAKLWSAGQGVTGINQVSTVASYVNKLEAGYKL